MMETKMPSVGAQAKAIRILRHCNSLRSLRELTAANLNAFVPPFFVKCLGEEDMRHRSECILHSGRLRLAKFIEAQRISCCKFGGR